MGNLSQKSGIQRSIGAKWSVKAVTSGVFSGGLPQEKRAQSKLRQTSLVGMGFEVHDYSAFIEEPGAFRVKQ